MSAPSGQKAMLIIERPARHIGFYHRQFIIDCPHATTDVIVGNYPITDPSRASGILDNLLKQHRETVAAAVAAGKEDEICTCQPPKLLSS